MTQFLPPNLLALFAAREPIPYLPPVDKLPYEKKTTGYTGIAAYVNFFENPEDTPPPIKLETREQRQERKRRAKAELAAYKLEQDIALWNPANNSNSSTTTDPYRTLFVARVNYDTSESKLRREFEIYGNIKKLAIIHDKNSKKPRGYAFIEYEREKDMHSAYKHADGRKIDGKRVLVDVERGRIVKGWFPRRLGGGLGGTRRGGPEVNVKHSGREEPGRDDHHYMGRDRDRPERPDRRRSRSRSRERRRKSRSRSRDRHRSDRHKRDRSRDRERVRDHDGASMDKGDGMDGANDVGPDGDAPPRKERRRSRSRDRGERRRRRSRSRDRKRRDHDKDRESRRSERDRDRGDRGGDRDERIKMMPPPAKEEQNSQDDMMQENYDNPGYEGEYNSYNNNNNMEANNYEGY